MNVASYQVESQLKDHSPVLIRALRESDKAAIRDGFSRLSNESVQARFFRTKNHLTDREVSYFTELDFERHVGLGVAAISGQQYLPIAVGRFIQSERNQGVAELALAVADAYHRLGVGKLLIHHLSIIATELNIQELECAILPSNQGMLRLLESLPQPVSRGFANGYILARIVVDIERSRL